MLRFLTCPIENVPAQVNKEKIQFKYLLANNGIRGKIISMKYLGGCSNHTLHVVVEAEKNQQQSLLVRLPGLYSDLLINREAERINTNIVSALGVCPAFENQFAKEGNPLQKIGYKVEEYLENAESLTHTNFYQYRKEALKQLKRVHQCGIQFAGDYNLLERIKLMCYVLQDVNGVAVNEFSYHHGKEKQKIAEVINEIEYYEQLQNKFGSVTKVPCHNDVPPFNFMKMITKEGKVEIKIIDWEYAAMNDPMAELAYIANERPVQQKNQSRNYWLIIMKGMFYQTVSCKMN